jgi:hypothetical protein
LRARESERGERRIDMVWNLAVEREEDREKGE